MGTIADFSKFRDRADADKWRRLQAATVMVCFVRAHGREPANLDELGQWAGANLSQPVDPFSVLTPEEVDEIRREMPELFS